MESKNTAQQSRLCPYYKKCGGCSLQNLPYPQQLRHKQVQLIRQLGRFGHVEEIIGMENPLHYRNKVQAAFGMKNGRLISGVYQSSTHRIVPVDSCMIEDEISDSIIVTLRRLMPGFRIKPYDRESGRGFMKHVLVRRGFRSGQVMVVLVTAAGDFPSQRSFVNALLGRHPEITTVVRSVNNTGVGLLLGEQSEVLYGSGFIEEQLCGLTFRISPKSFYQINPVQTEILYSKAVEFAQLSGSETLIDAYCGTGTIGLIMSKHAGRVIGMELNPDAVSDAKANAQLNGCGNVTFVCGDAGRLMVEAARRRESVDVVVTDPPRAGCSRDFLQSLLKLAPKRVVYISCNPDTLGRDMAFLTKNGYKADMIQPVDMFPFTGHVECVVLMSK